MYDESHIGNVVYSTEYQCPHCKEYETDYDGFCVHCGEYVVQYDDAPVYEEPIKSSSKKSLSPKKQIGGAFLQDKRKLAIAAACAAAVLLLVLAISALGNKKDSTTATDVAGGLGSVQPDFTEYYEATNAESAASTVPATLPAEQVASIASESESNISSEGSTPDSERTTSADNTKQEPTSVAAAAPVEQNTETPATSETPVEETTTSQETNVQNETSAEESQPQTGLRPEFKSAMDSYEAFVDEYVTFMKKHQENPTDVNMIADYTSYLAKYTDFMNKFNAWQSDTINNEETQYYIEVQTRCVNKLASVGM